MAVLICVVSCSTLNYYHPHRNRTVLGVAQIAFILTTFKYASGILLGPGTLMTTEDQEALGAVLIVLDIIFVVGSFVGAVLVVHLLRKAIAKTSTKVIPAEGGGKEKGGSVESGVAVGVSGL